jgi:hypothetical protein
MKIRVGLAAAVGSLLIPLAVAQVASQAQPRHRSRQQKLAQPPPAAPEPVAPPTPEQRPATPPQVAYNGGLLTITADNSTLGDILRAVHRQTGASVDVPGNATERVVGSFGPGPARDVVASLLNGSHFNYVLVGSETNPTGLDRVVLISKPLGDQAPVQQARMPTRMQPAPQTVDAGDAANDDDAAQDMIPDASEATDEQANQAQGEDAAQPQQPGQSAIKTPEQLLQELQQRQQQMQQQGAPVPPGYPPNPNAGPTPQQQQK